MRSAILCVTVVLCCVSVLDAQAPRGSYLVQHVMNEDGKFASRTIAYEPKAGDLIFFNNHKPHWVVLYKVVGSDAPYHSALIFRKSNGEFCTVEAGPDDTAWCRVLPLEARMREFKGMIHIRRVKKQIAPESEKALEDFALKLDGKRYAWIRVLLQLTPFRCRTPIRRELFGATYTDRTTYMCAELAVAGGTIAGLFDPRKHPGNAIYPRDILHDDFFDISAKYHEAELWTPFPLPEPPRATFGTPVSAARIVEEGKAGNPK
jgi:hypothetical protein